MWKDEIVEEVRKARHTHAAALGFDLRRIYEDLKHREQLSGRHIVTLPPRPVRRGRRASGASRA
jgi:hypothetical protein